jgi:hypothetical protein
MMGLHPIGLPYLLVSYNELDQGDLGKQGQHHGRCGGRCQAFVAWELLIMRVQIEAHLPLDAAIDQQTDHRQHGHGRHPFRLLEPHGSDSRGILDPTQPRFYSGILVLLGWEKVGIATHLSGHGRGQHHPSLGLCWVGECLYVHAQAIACLQRGRVTLGGTPPPSPARAAGVGDDPIAYCMIPPRVWTATAPARLVVLILRDGRYGIRFTGTPAGVHPLDVVGEGFSFLRVGADIRLRVLLGQLAGRHHEKA